MLEHIDEFESPRGRDELLLTKAIVSIHSEPLPASYC